MLLLAYPFFLIKPENYTLENLLRLEITAKYNASLLFEV